MSCKNTNKELEEDLEVTGKKNLQGGYKGSQDTGDSNLRSLGTDVQKNDGIIDDDNKQERPDE